jgi:hypothetical protein
MTAEIRKLENAHIALWLMKDVSWCSNWRLLGLVMSIPTIILAARLAWLGRHNFSELAHNGAVCCWIAANITWMVGEFYYGDTTRGYAKVFFFTGVALLALYYLRTLFGPKAQTA